MHNKDTARSGGTGFFGILAIVFITLKLTGFIDWSWWWVTAPLWGPFAAIMSIVCGLLLVSGVISIFCWISERK